MLLPYLDIDVVQLQELQTLRQTITELQAVADQALHAEYTLRQEYEHVCSLVNDMRAYALFLLNPHGYIVTWNKGAHQLTGYTAEEQIGRHFSACYPHVDRAIPEPDYALQIARAEGFSTEECELIRNDGSLFWANIVITAMFDETGTLRGFSHVIHDLTQQKEAEAAQLQLHQQELQLHQQELQIAAEQAARAQAEAHLDQRDIFLSAAAHEFRTPLTAVSNCVQFLQRRSTRETLTWDDIQKPFATIAAQVQRLERLASMILSSTRVAFGVAAQERTPLDLGKSTTQMVEELQCLTTRHRIELNLPSSPLRIAGNAIQTEQAISNLIHNAMKYSPHGGTITVTAQRRGEQAVLTICDEGQGIPPNDLPHIFERFYCATNCQQATHTSLGIGLYLVKAFVEMQGGTVEVESRVGEGTTFRLVFPLLPEDC